MKKKTVAIKKRTVIIAASAVVIVPALVLSILHFTVSEPYNPGPEAIIEVTTEEGTTLFHIPPLDLRGYAMDHFEVEQWFLERINYHREAYGIHPYNLYTPARVTSIEHSLDMRDNNFGRNVGSDGRTHQERHHTWLGYNRTRVTSAHSSSHDVARGPLTQEGVNEIADRILYRETSRSFLLNPTYYEIGIGFSIQENGRGRLSITMASQENERAAHRARTPAEREEHRQAYLERVREERGWTPPQ